MVASQPVCGEDDAAKDDRVGTGSALSGAGTGGSAALAELVLLAGPVTTRGDCTIVVDGSISCDKVRAAVLWCDERAGGLPRECREGERLFDDSEHAYEEWWPWVDSEGGGE